MIDNEKKVLQIDFESILMRLLTSWLISGIANLVTVDASFDVILFVQNASLLQTVIIFLISFILISIIKKATSLEIDPVVLAFFSFVFSVISVSQKKNIYFTLGILVFLIAVGYYLLRDNKLKLQNIVIQEKQMIVIAAISTAFFILFTATLTILRYRNYSTSTYDFGIFSQMFYYMKKTGLPFTTCERNGLTSHMEIHFSPIFYVLLPGYLIFSKPEYLQIMQALVLASGVVPVILLARHYKLSNKITAAIAFAYCFFPALAGGCFYDIHENIFLTPLILWVLYFMEKEKWALMYMFSALTWLVKEDAPFYIACIALFIFFVKKQKLHGVIMLATSVMYFLCVKLLLEHFGEGALHLNSGLSNFISNESDGLFGIFKTIFVNPAYFISEVFQNKVVDNTNQEKIIYMLTMLIPLGFMPITGKKLSHLILVIPFVVINLMSNNPYMHNINFQYHFGTLALFFYLTIINIASVASNAKKYLIPFICVASVLMFLTTLYSYTDNIKTFVEKRHFFKEIDVALESIPQDASVQASGYFVPKLSNRKILYDVSYNQDCEQPIETEYIALDTRTGVEKDTGKFLKRFTKKGYEVFCKVEDGVTILKKSST